MLLWIPLLPFVGFLVNTFGARRLPAKVIGAVASLAMLAAFGVSAIAVARLVSLPPESREITQTVFTWIGSADFQVPLRSAARPVVGADDPGRHRHRFSDSRLFDGLHDRGRAARVRALLRVPEPLRRVHAAARARRQLRRDVRRLGRRGPVLVPAHRLLVQEAGRRPMPARRRSSSTASATWRSCWACCWRSRSSGPSNFSELSGGDCGAAGGHALRRRVGDCAAALHRRDRQVGADSVIRLVARRDGGSDAGLGPHPRRDHGDGWRLSDRPQRRVVRARARGAGDRRGRRHGDRAVGGRHRHGAERHQAGARVFDRLAARLHVHWRWASARMPRASFICSRTRFSRPCCSSDRARSFTRLRESRTCATWAGSRRSCRSPYWTFLDRRAGDRGCARSRRILQQGRDSVSHVRRRPHGAVGSLAQSRR